MCILFFCKRRMNLENGRYVSRSFFRRWGKINKGKTSSTKKRLERKSAEKPNKISFFFFSFLEYHVNQNCFLFCRWYFLEPGLMESPFCSSFLSTSSSSSGPWSPLTSTPSLTLCRFPPHHVCGSSVSYLDPPQLFREKNSLQASQDLC